MTSHLSSKRRENISGFTLIEVLIALGIFAFIGIFTAQLIQHSAQSKRKIQDMIDRKSGLQAALRLMSQDIQLAFNYRDINTELYNAAQKSRGKKTGGSTGGTGGTGSVDGVSGATSPGGTVPPVTPDPVDSEKFKLKEVQTFSRFLGETDSLNFTSLNNIRTQKNQAVSNQSEIGYYIDRCTNRIKKDIVSDCLWRRTTPYIDSEIKEGGEASVLLENIKSLKFRYLAFGKEAQWQEKWFSEGGEEVTRDKFPGAVEITLIINDTKFDPPKEIAMTVVSAIRFTNNKPDEVDDIIN